MHRSRFSIVPLFAVLLLTATLSSCAARGPATLNWSTLAEPLWESNERLLSNVTIAGDVALAYVSMGGGNESLVARDLSTGRELWRDHTLPGTTATGVAHWVAALETDREWSVAYLRKSGSDYRWATMAVVDARDGTALGTSNDTQWIVSTRPSECDETFCVEGWVSGVDEQKLWQYDMEANLLVESDGADAPYLEGNAFSIGHYLVAGVNDEGRQTLSYGRDGRYVWTRPYTDVFGPGTSTGGGWAWTSEHDGIPLIGVGYAYTERDRSVPGTMTFELGQSRTVGLDPDSGATVWAHDHAERCNVGGRVLADEVVVLCRFNSGSGAFEWTGERGENLRYEDVDLDIIGVDAIEGSIRWEVPLGDEPGNYNEDLPWLDSGTNPVVIQDGHVLIIDRQIGNTAQVPDDATLICTSVFDDPVELWAFPAEERSEYWNKYSMPCAADGTPYLGGGYSYGSLEAAGYDTAETVVLAGADGMIAFAPLAHTKEQIP